MKNLVAGRVGIHSALSSSFFLMLLRVCQIKLYKKAEEDGDPDLYLIEYEDGDMEVCSR